MADIVTIVFLALFAIFVIYNLILEGIEIYYKATNVVNSEEKKETTENKLTDEQIINSLEICSNENYDNCDGCPCFKGGCCKGFGRVEKNQT